MTKKIYLLIVTLLSITSTTHATASLEINSVSYINSTQATTYADEAIATTSNPVVFVLDGYKSISSFTSATLYFVSSDSYHSYSETISNGFISPSTGKIVFVTDYKHMADYSAASTYTGDHSISLYNLSGQFSYFYVAVTYRNSRMAITTVNDDISSPVPYLATRALYGWNGSAYTWSSLNYYYPTLISLNCTFTL